MAGLNVHLDLNLGTRGLRGVLVVAMLLAAAPELCSETETLTTYYPSPSGVYTQMITTGNTYLARDGGNSSRVGVGTTNPAAKLDVAGQVRIADGTQGANRILTSDANGLATWVAQPKGFGGAYCTGGGSVAGYANPITGKFSCPAGYAAKPMFASGGLGNCSGQCVFIYCYMCY